MPPRARPASQRRDELGRPPGARAVDVDRRLAALAAAGTSPWLDQIGRSLTRGGELARMVEEGCLRGVTSNPAIFEAAILGSPEYGEQLARLAGEGLPARAIYQRIALEDVQEAADVLRPLFDELDGGDGYVSLEVDPDLAFDAERTLAQAREYWARVDRPNVMIKIPGTAEALPAISGAIADGINVNVTLLFVVEAYATVAEAYIAGLERRHAQGRELDVRSVASFFVSRVDSEVDGRLEALGRLDLRGQAAVANARAAYRRFEEIFAGERFAALRAAGAHVQRPLWASTGVKNPRYPDTKYVAELVGPGTVNTMPMATLLACAERLEVGGATVREDPTAPLGALADAGIDMTDVTGKLLRDGVAAFVTPMQKLLAGIEARREALLAARPATIAASLPDAPPAAGALGARPRRRTAVVTCMDGRIDPVPLLGFERGDAHVLRNAGGIVTDDVVRSLSASQRLLGTREILVVMHDRCGLQGASEEQFAHALEVDGARPCWRLGAFDDVEAALGRSLARLRASPELPSRDRIRGLIFDPDSGDLREPEQA